MNTTELVKKIHHDFYTATMDGNTKAHKMIKLGFINAKGTSNIDNAKILGLEHEYLIKYPTYKFISNNAILHLCKKYHLVYAPIDRYKGDIPEKNISEIKAFVDKYGHNVVAISSPYYVIDDDNSRIRQFKLNKWAKKQPKCITKDECVDKLVELGEDRVRAEKIFRWIEPSEIKAKDNLYICAPIKDIITKGLVFSGLSYNVPDPITICRVPYGGLILSAWGDEAADEIIIERQN